MYLRADHHDDRLNRKACNALERALMERGITYSMLGAFLTGGDVSHPSLAREAFADAVQAALVQASACYPKRDRAKVTMQLVMT